MSLNLPEYTKILFSFYWGYFNNVVSMSQLYLCEISKFKISSIVVNFNPDLLGLIHQRYIKIFHVQTSMQYTQTYKTVKSEINFDENNFDYKTFQNQNLKINYSRSYFNQSINIYKK